jgi:hypothetical protein
VCDACPENADDYAVILNAHAYGREFHPVEPENHVRADGAHHANANARVPFVRAYVHVRVTR